jgi:hypothetical protein
VVPTEADRAREALSSEQDASARYGKRVDVIELRANMR